MDKPVLITYATRSGSTAGVAEAIATAFAESGTPVDLRPMTAITTLGSYRAVVAGSAIQGQKWLPEAMRFVETHRSELRQKPFAAFLVCITLSMQGSSQYRAGVASWLAPVRAMVPTVSEGLFAGALNFQNMPLTSNTLMMRLPVLLGMWKVGDHRDWNAVRAWAKQIRPLL